ncbi:MAG TPA: hypothetical protein VH092_10395 [Urbifossiella sp.]|jgi:hypothetical protein|nr:hypothetical protein [Urbifossiella sp.]
MEQTGNFGLAALGRVGAFTLEVLSRPEGGWALSVESPAWCFEFPLAGPAVVGELDAFFRSYAGRSEFSELVIGSFGVAVVKVVKDDEYADRFYLRAAGDGLLTEFTLVGLMAQEFAAAVAEAAAEFEA